eukprot:5942081-Pleurochrysis_carterae.AAC.1
MAACVRMSVRARARACVRERVRACASVRVRAQVRACAISHSGSMAPASRVRPEIGASAIVHHFGSVSN